MRSVQPFTRLRSSGGSERTSWSRLRVSRTKQPPGLSARQKRSSSSRSSSSEKKPIELNRFTVRSNAPENSMSRMSSHASVSSTPASPPPLPPPPPPAPPQP